uniref:Uncharacterized protein n=1 Tax=uncultured organism TaxID=155900 RepID=A0A7L9QBV2_9ZZZZ|nr:hypothetical protein [uncultured organism]
MTVPEDFEIRARETTAVQLTRMEGKLDLVASQLSDVRVVVARHDTDINHLKAMTQQLGSDAINRELTVAATAKALASSEESRRVAADRRWTPAMRLGAIVSLLATALSALATAYIAAHG